ncbi:MAG: DUF4870 domain-containing protein [Chloroflexi bacterium]|nr:DUF4870 domain-containing protein [Chloroflexota bacterium]MBI5714603.1 DUF4870 domain-containing protein [Chloroflexota bacterium]
MATEPPTVQSPSPNLNMPLSQSDERLWAMLAHLSILLNLATGFLGVVAPIIIYALYKDRSRYVAYQSMQAFVFQLVWWLGGSFLIGFVWAVTGILASIFIGLLCLPFACLFTFLPLGALVYGVIGGLKCNNGDDFKYWLIGDWLRGTLTA